MLGASGFGRLEFMQVIWEFGLRYRISLEFSVERFRPELCRTETLNSLEGWN